MDRTKIACPLAPVMSLKHLVNRGNKESAASRYRKILVVCAIALAATAARTNWPHAFVLVPLSSGSKLPKADVSSFTSLLSLALTRSDRI